MSSSGAAEPDPAAAGPGSAFFEHQVRRDGRVLVTLRARATDDGVIVESEIAPASQNPGAGPLTRPFTFATADQARRFADEALVAFEYLNCVIT